MRRLMTVIALLAAAAAPLLAADMKAEEKAIADRTAAFAATWNHHDGKGLAGFFAPDGDLINPFGRVARGRAEIEKLFTDEQSTFMKSSTYQVKVAWIDWVKPDVAVVTWESTALDIAGPDGKPMPPFHHYVTSTMLEKEGTWWVVAARPMAPLPAPTAPAK